MAVMEEKNQLTAELDRVRRQMESIQSERDRLMNELDRVRRQTSLAESLDLSNLNSEYYSRIRFFYVSVDSDQILSLNHVLLYCIRLLEVTYQNFLSSY